MAKTLETEFRLHTSNPKTFTSLKGGARNGQGGPHKYPLMQDATNAAKNVKLCAQYWKRAQILKVLTLEKPTE